MAFAGSKGCAVVILVERLTLPDVEAVVCPDPQCAGLAQIEDRWTHQSTDGPVEVVKVRCSAGCWYTVLAEHLSPATDR